MEQDEASRGCAIPIPFDPRAVFGRARVPVVVTVAGHAYRSTIFSMSGRRFVPFAKAHREAAGVGPGDRVSVDVRRDDAPRTVEVSADLSAALDAAGVAGAAWEALSYTRRKEAVRAVVNAKRPETRRRRIEAVVAELAGADGRAGR